MYAKRPEVGHLCVFGCKRIVMKRYQDRGEFEGVREQCLLVGCAVNATAWRVIVELDGKHA
jgi:hypothetical protein